MIETKATGRQACFKPIPKLARLILVEGLDDGLLVEEMCMEEGLADQIQILCFAQSGKMRDFLDLLVRDANFGLVTHLGLTKDADNDPEAARQSLTDAWARAKRAIADIGREEPRCSVFVVPDNHQSGRLEDLCLAAPTIPKLLKCAEDMYTCAGGAASHKIDREKSIVAAYLSMMERPGLQIGTGAQAGCWNLRSDVFGPLRDFVKSVGQ
jgi:hypothetical protein